jgi:hypothetical protein
LRDPKVPPGEDRYRAWEVAKQFVMVAVERRRVGAIDRAGAVTALCDR